MADLGNIAALKAANLAVLNNSVPDESIEPSDHNQTMIDTIDTLTNGVILQNALVSGTNIKTVKSVSILGSGDIAIDENATHTGEVTGATALTVNKTAITNKTLVTLDPLDHILIADASDSDNLKKVLASDFGGGINKTNIINVDAILGDNSTGSVATGKPFLTPEHVLANVTNVWTITGNTTSGNATITAVSDTTNVVVGDYFTGTGIPYNSVVLSKTINTVTLSKTATATASGITIKNTRLYTLQLSGNFTATSSWGKWGFNFDLDTFKAQANWGNFCLFDYTENILVPINHSLNRINGTGINAKILGSSTILLTVQELFLTFENIYTNSTTRVISSISTQLITVDVKCEIRGGFLDARFGAVANIGGTGNILLDFNSYGLLAGIIVSALYPTIKGTHQTPAAITVLNAGAYANVTGSFFGSTSFSFYSSIKASLNGSTHTFSLCDVTLERRSGGTFTFTGAYKNSLKCHADDNSIDLTIDAGATLSVYGETNISTLIINGVCHHFGSNTSANTIGGSGSLFNFGRINSISGCATIYNHGYAKIRDITAVTYFENYGHLITGYRGLILNGAKTFINKGLFESNELLFDIDAMIQMTSASALFENWGIIKAFDSSTTKPVILKSAGTLKLYAGSYIKVANGKSPIKCTANTSASKDIIVESCVTNCDGTTYGLSFAFDGGSFAPNDIMNTFTTTRENILF
jgi:hypothetical protein